MFYQVAVGQGMFSNLRQLQYEWTDVLGAAVLTSSVTFASSIGPRGQGPVGGKGEGGEPHREGGCPQTPAPYMAPFIPYGGKGDKIFN